MIDIGSILTEPILEQLREAMLATYYKDSSNQVALAALEDHVRGRFEMCCRYLVPWIQRYVDLQNMNLIEIGCGTGSTTAALALASKSIEGFDIEASIIDAAVRRMEVLNIKNAQLFLHDPQNLLDEIRNRHPAQTVDAIVMFAVLEHQTYEERITTLRSCWDLLRPGGLLIVGDTPNRLTWHDAHTSWLPFFDALPEEVALDYYQRSPRPDFCEAISIARSHSEAEARNTLIRWGRGISYHDFEIALGPVENLVLGDGFDPEPLAYYGVPLETRMLYTYVKKKELNIPPGFLREPMDLILQKPDPTAPLIRKRSTEELDAIIRPLDV
jgi:2-polyprenyl-3-methyl-5-hydroxy-6-metoxy-1,4-benzoquinol methylase